MALIKMIDSHLKKALNKFMLNLEKNIINYNYNELVDIIGIRIYFINKYLLLYYYYLLIKFSIIYLKFLFIFFC